MWLYFRVESKKKNYGRLKWLETAVRIKLFILSIKNRIPSAMRTLSLKFLLILFRDLNHCNVQPFFMSIVDSHFISIPNNTRLKLDCLSNSEAAACHYDSEQVVRISLRSGLTNISSVI